MKFNRRIENLEVHSCNDHLLLDGEHTKIEIIKWEAYKHIPGIDRGEYCYTIAYFTPTKDGWDLICLPERYIEVVQNREYLEIFNTLVEAAYDYLLSLGEEEDA